MEAGEAVLLEDRTHLSGPGGPHLPRADSLPPTQRGAVGGARAGETRVQSWPGNLCLPVGEVVNSGQFPILRDKRMIGVEVRGA